MKRICLLLLAVCMVCGLAPGAMAVTPYWTYTRYDEGYVTMTQTAYEPVRTMTKFGDESLKMPSDIRLGPDGNLYICDSGNKRIVVVTRQGELVKIIGDKATLKSPMGVFVTEDGNVYVADENARAVVVFDKEGNVINEYGKPDHPLFGDTAPYKPVKVVVDRRGNLYINSTGNTNGLVQISPGEDGGEFLGYFGANQTNVSFLTKIRKTIFTDDQLSRTAGIVPISVANMSIDDKGMIYTVNRIDGMDALRKLNVAGKNILTPDWYEPYPAGVATSSAGNIYVVSKNGYIYEYTSEGKILFIFGAYDNGQQRMGLFKSVSGIVVDEADNLYVLDETNGAVEVFAPTEFCDMVHTAFRLFNDGKYTESKEPWSEILRMNSMFSYASIGLGEALYREGNYAEAMTAFRNGREYDGYSDAFWEIRSDWLHQNLSGIIIAIVVLAVVFAIAKRINRKRHFTKPLALAGEKVKRAPIIRQLLFSFRILKNPYDAYYGILRENRASYASAGIVMVVFYALSVISKYYSGFLFKSVPDGYYNLLGDLLNIVGIYGLFVICLYLICTITEGEATFKSIVVGTAYALLPVMIAMVVQLGLTNVLTYNEDFFITLVNVVAYGWSGILLFLMVMYLNDFTIKKTIWTIFLTAFAALIAVALIFVIYVLISQLVDFIVSIYGEVVYRFVRT